MWLTGELSDLVHVSCGVGYPVASHRSRTLLPRADVIWVAEVITDGFRHCSSSARWNKIPVRRSGSLQIIRGSSSTTAGSATFDSSIILEMWQSQNQGLSCRPKPEGRKRWTKIILLTSVYITTSQASKYLNYLPKNRGALRDGMESPPCQFCSAIWLPEWILPVRSGR